jgi:serine/threonine-protein kinase
MSAPATDLNLLFAVLALQNDLVGKDALLAAMTVWGLEKHRPLGDILVERGDLLVEDRQLIDGLIERQLWRHTSAEKSLAALSVSPPLRRQLPSLCAPEMEQSLAHLSTAVDGHGTVGYAPTGSADGGLRYRVLRPHARGGLGEVFVAEDTELHREVALKEMQARHAGHEASRGRFVLEAEITGGLEHPGIVPVYGLGSYADGRPFYAMRFIKGDNLKEAIARFHRPTPWPDYHSLAFRQLLGRFIDVCNAVAYAHSRGVLHRDLKPGNIMLGRFGETLVVDWGLAKVVGRGEPGTLATPDEETLMPRSGSGVVETLAGSAIGTPAYMSPEQATGRIADLGPATDVYSLGATFYTLLTNRSPVDGNDTAELLRKVERGEVGFVQPALPTSTEAIPAPLVAVCRKAMRLDPRDRYASPLALAADLEHWLADEPVAAYTEPWRVRAGRWVRRHRTAVTGGVAAVCVALVCLSVAAVLLNTARTSERQAKLLAEQNEHKAEAQRDKARERFVLARTAVDKYHTQVSESPELKAYGLEKLRTRLLETAAEFYEGFVKEEEADASVEAERSMAYRRLGRIYQDTGRHADADRALMRGLGICQRLADEHAGEPRPLAELAQAHYMLGWLYQNIGRNDEAEKNHLRSVSILEGLLREHPQESPYQSVLASTFNDLGMLYFNTNRFTKAREAHDNALAIRAELVWANPDEEEFRAGLRASHNNLAVVYSESGNTTLAEKAYEQALEVAQQLADRYPNVPAHQSSLAGIQYNVSFIYRRAGQRAKAEEALGSALRIQDGLVREHPAIVDYQKQLAHTQSQLATVYQEMNRLTDAVSLHKQSLSVLQKLVSAYPLVIEFAVDLGGGYSNHGYALVTLRDYDAATASLDNAVKTLEAVLSKDDGNLKARRFLLNAHEVRGSMYRARGLKKEAEDAYRYIAEAHDRLARDNPGSAEVALRQGAAYCNYGNRLFENQKAQPALDAYSHAAEVLDGLLQKDARNPQARLFLTNSLSGRGLVLSKLLDRHSEGIKHLDRALTLAGDNQRDFLRGARACTLARMGDHRQAVTEAEALAKSEKTGGVDLVNAAYACAMAVSATARDMDLAAAERDRLADQYAARAVELLAKAAAMGYYSASASREDLRTASELATLRSRPDFKKLLADVEKATPQPK